MRILFEITHPKHALMFKNAILELGNRGYEILITAREKDITCDLLDSWNLPYHLISKKSGADLIRMCVELGIRDIRMYRLARHFQPDVFVGRVGPSAAHIGYITRKPVVVFDDMESATLQQWISYPFASHICTSKHYEKDWGSKHVRYNSFDELAYLHPNVFQPDHNIIKSYGLEPYSYSIVRYVSWEAAHDRNHSGFNREQRHQVIELLNKTGPVFVSFEGNLPADLQQFNLPCTPDQFHHFLAFANITVGESPTVAAESAMLGVPAVLFSSLTFGSINKLAYHYHIVYNPPEFIEVPPLIEKITTASRTRKQWMDTQNQILLESVDLSQWIVNFIGSLCQTIHENPGDSYSNPGRFNSTEK
ncbi:DUF354 domain-containing protein [bacterium]|nr:DUF354 domain-containing protein [candidate division CSSED10-310 bacterium]